jgi:hypothetical protein
MAADEVTQLREDIKTLRAMLNRCCADRRMQKACAAALCVGVHRD